MCSNYIMETSSETYSTKYIDKLRAEFIKELIRQMGGKSKLKYYGLMDPDDIPHDGRNFMKTKERGVEKQIEYHMFEMKDGTPVVGQWRLV